MDLDLDAKDIANIESAISEGGKIWESKLLDDFKKKIKEYYRLKQNEQCCYCRKNFAGEFAMVIDIEHILPKNHFNHLMFTTYNLSISCKRCNMYIKKQDLSFIVDMVAVKQNPLDTNLYKIIHPNFDNYYSHLQYYSQIVNDEKLIKYKVVANSSKGQFTYDYFKLTELEVNSVNRAQGLLKQEPLSNKIDPNITKRLEDLLRKI